MTTWWMKNRIAYSGTMEPSGGGAAAAPAPSSGGDGGSSGGTSGGMDISEEVKSIMDWDPFGPPSTSASEGSAEPGAGAAAPTTDPAVGSAPAVGTDPATAVPPSQPPAPATPPQDLSAQALADAARAMREAAEKMGQPAPASAPAGPAAPVEDEFQPKDAQGNNLDYSGINIPDQLLAAMNSENPTERKMATTHLIASSMRTVHRMVLEQSVKMMQQQVAQAVPRFVQQQIMAHQRQQEVYQDFYGTFPDLSAPEIRPVIMATAERLQTEMNNPGWTPQFRDALGKRVRDLLRGYGGGPAAAPVAAVAPPVTTGVMTPTSARPAQVGQPTQAQPWDDLFG